MAISTGRSTGRKVILAATALLAAVAVPGSAQAAVGPNGYGDCGTYRFCAWDKTGGSSWRMEWSGTIACNEVKDLADTGWRNRIESIKNNSTATIVLYDYDMGYVLWTSRPGNWGDLPTYARNNADQLYRLC